MRVGLTAVLVLVLGVGCSSSADTPATVDAGGGDAAAVDAGGGDAGRDAGRADAGTPDAGPSRAGLTCAMDGECGAALTCDVDIPGGFCTAECTDGTQASERSQCGGAGSTCLSYGDGDEAISYCTRTCTPTARPGTAGACRPGQACTGWWFTHETYEPDAVGCDLFCTADSQCGAERCNLRTGECGEAADMAARADGEPCDPTVETGTPARNRQCRGICFQIGDMPSQGQCGSHIDLTVTPRCPDAPERIAPEAPTDDAGERLDNLGECLFKTCATNADCTAPLTCLPAMNGAPPTCGYR